MKRVIQFRYPDDCEPPEVYPVDDPEAMAHLGSLVAQYDPVHEDGTPVYCELKIKDLTDEQWAEAVRLGEEMEGGCDEDEDPTP